MARVTAKRKAFIKEFVETHEKWLKTTGPYEHLLLKTAFRFLHEFLGE